MNGSSTCSSKENEASISNSFLSKRRCAACSSQSPGTPVKRSVLLHHFCVMLSIVYLCHECLTAVEGYLTTLEQWHHNRARSPRKTLQFSNPACDGLLQVEGLLLEVIRSRASHSRAAYRVVVQSCATILPLVSAVTARAEIVVPHPPLEPLIVVVTLVATCIPSLPVKTVPALIVRGELDERQFTISVPVACTAGCCFMPVALTVFDCACCADIWR